MHSKINIFWFRRDLRLHDNVGLLHALKSEHPVLPIFIFDTEILEKLPKNDARVTFIHKTLQELRSQLQKTANSSLAMFYGSPKEILSSLTQRYKVQTVCTNHDYEPYAEKRDAEIKDFLLSKDITFKTFKDQVIFEKNEVIKEDGQPYVVYTPYKNKWKACFNPEMDLKLSLIHI